ncbi:Sec-independent protein translocase TatB [Ornithinimicrobium pratense]|uniref:Sec-independent protein translocase TatB n=1 Tax=Ornithinimicrobium pratense TaxID=2593973 RepID=A0A5J6V5F6_9MICO|nr:Sec-independent protein translocase TatB [Ornithinimicrobium pratense]QFG69189.1 Sec-independent protein translocase TatB [Ornithinimicrobium pratense]
MIGTLHGGEIVLLILAALILLGPSRLPGYAAKLGQGVRYLRDLAEGAKGQIEEELGPTFQDIDWRQLDPRQYDPRRIVRDALAAPPSRPAKEAASGRTDQAAPDPRPTLRASALHDPSLPTPFDVDAT